MWSFVHKFSSPQHFYRLSRHWLTFLYPCCAALFGFGLYGALITAPADFQQGDAFRILYLHVPVAFLSISIYLSMAISASIALIWKIKLADMATYLSAPIGATFTALALFTGSVWGKPMWGTFWVWDARLTSELILLFLYLGYMALITSLPDRKQALRAGAILLLIGLVDIPIIHFSVEWWSTLHQGSSLSLLRKPTIAHSMLIPLLVMISAFTTLYATLLISALRTEILWQERRTQWVQIMVKENNVG